MIYNLTPNLLKMLILKLKPTCYFWWKTLAIAFGRTQKKHGSCRAHQLHKELETW